MICTVNLSVIRYFEILPKTMNGFVHIERWTNPFKIFRIAKGFKTL
jgi:hypothetical protein